MKSIKLFVFIMLVISGKNFAQTADNYRIIPEQAGTITITSVKTIINLRESLKNILRDSKGNTSYYVLFTATSDSELPFVSNKSAESFTVNYKPKTNADLPSSVDYVVFLKVEQKASVKPETFIKPDLRKAP